MIIGVTGTQIGGSIYQLKKLDILLEYFKCTEFHHGDCLGVDTEAHDIALKYAKKIIIHPPNIASKRAYSDKKNKDGVEIVVLPEKPYLDRNKDIVESVELMFGLPKEYREQIRSGTWMTIRYTKKLKKPLIIIYSDGSYKGFNLKNKI